MGATGAVPTAHRALLLFLGSSHVGHARRRDIKLIHVYCTHQFELEWLLGYHLVLQFATIRHVYVDRRCLRPWVDILVHLHLLSSGLVVGLMLPHLLLLSRHHLLLLVRLASILRSINEDILYPRNLLPQELVLLREIVILALLQLDPLFVDVLLAVDLVLMQTLLLVPCPLHFSLDLLKLSFHLITIAFIISLKLRSVFTRRL